MAKNVHSGPISVNANTVTDQWQLMYTNIRGMKGKLTSLTALLEENKPNLFLITETQLRSNTGMNIPGYEFYGRKREGGFGGGVGILVRSDIRQYTFTHYSNRNLEILWV